MSSIQENVSLKPYNTFGINSCAKYFLTVENADDVLALLDDNPLENQAMFILGGGSNVLFLSDFPGIVIKNNIKGIEWIEENNDSVLLKVGAGENWHEFVLYAISKQLGGIENLSLIPGNVGAAPIQNIGAYGVEVESVCEKVEAIYLPTGGTHLFSRSACKFSYRNSYFKQKGKGKYLITYVYFRLLKKSTVNISYGTIARELADQSILQPTIEDVSNTVIKIRTRKLPDPYKIGNAGSFFKNPVVARDIFQSIYEDHPQVPHYPTDNDQIKIPAGWLIEQCGWKGYRENNAGVYQHQALVLVNHGDATGKDIYHLSNKIKQSVFEQFNINLEREVQIVLDKNYQD